jgi:hypothetical protein
MAAKRRYIREGDELNDDELVVRGGALDPESLRTDAIRNHQIYGVYGVSVFALREATLDELAQHPPLVRFRILTVMTVRAIRFIGLRLEATGRNPHHFDLSFSDLDRGIESLANCAHRSGANPYHQG